MSTFSAGDAALSALTGFVGDGVGWIDFEDGCTILSVTSLEVIRRKETASKVTHPFHTPTIHLQNRRESFHIQLKD